MSSEIYPIAVADSVRVQLSDRTAVDEFEDGATSARQLWTPKYFKRRFTIEHRNLKEADFRVLRSFAAGHGRYDTFWFRDNFNRGGFAQVRFAQDLDARPQAGRNYHLTVTLDEAAPSRVLPDYYELALLFDPVYGGTALPFIWWDANRLNVWKHVPDHGATIKSELTVLQNEILTDTAGNGIARAQESSLSPLYPDGITTSPITLPWISLGLVQSSNWNYYKSDGTWNLGKPAFTAFLIAKAPTSSTRQTVVQLGQTVDQQCLGIQLDASNYFKPWIGGSQAFTNGQYENNPASTFRSLAYTTAASSNDHKFYVDGALIGTDTHTRTTVNGAAYLAGQQGGSNELTGSIAHCLLFNAELPLADIQTLHNLFAHQYGLTEV